MELQEGVPVGKESVSAADLLFKDLSLCVQAPFHPEKDALFVKVLALWVDRVYPRNELACGIDLRVRYRDPVRRVDRDFPCQDDVRIIVLCVRLSQVRGIPPYKIICAEPRA